MGIFISNYENKLDAKGRISVPALFREALKNEDFNGIIAYQSFINPCIEACGMERIEKLANSIDSLDPYADERDAFATSILGGSKQIAIDNDGRIILPEELISFAGLKDKAIFVGKGFTFEIWNPEKFEKYFNNSREIAKVNRGKLRLG
ncbi:MAG: cell division/cell wall cluster transcriptional repressor MraZ [Rickettsiales bacterium]|nr:cell division/cell wall cluster transcriptional repressor MraZ [Rickettsiales bacterium]